MQDEMPRPLPLFHRPSAGSSRRPSWGLLTLALAAVATFTFATTASAQDDTPESFGDDMAAQVDETAANVEIAVDDVVEEEEVDPTTIDTDLSASTFDELDVTPGQYRANNIWVLIAAALVFIMHLGFGCVESGLCRAKNSVNILTKNLWIICTGILAYWAWGFCQPLPG